MSQFDHVGVSVSPAFINVHPTPNSFSAWRKYRPSVQHLASVVVTIANPAEPVKPVMNSRLASQGARYSEESDADQRKPSAKLPSSSAHAHPQSVLR